MTVRSSGHPCSSPRSQEVPPSFGTRGWLWDRALAGLCCSLPAGGGFAPKKPIYTSYLGPLKGTEKSRCPKGNENNYGMDLNSDDSTDDENEPRKPVPVWADGTWLNQAITHQYYHPVDVDQLFGLIPSPRLEDIFGKSKPRYFKRTSSAVWLSPPGTRGTCCPSCNFEN